MYQVGGFGGDIGGILADWEALGVFAYALPFLLIFAMIFGILSQTKIFKESKGVNGIIALVVALMALQFDFVPRFFSEIFPRVGIGLVILLIALIFLGMFMSGRGIMMAIGVVVLIVVVIQSFGAYGGSGGDFLADNWPNLIFAIIVIVAVALIWGGGSGKKDKGQGDESPLARALRGK